MIADGQHHHPAVPVGIPDYFRIADILYARIRQHRVARILRPCAPAVIAVGNCL